MKVNINDRIKVKLTVRGERVHFDHYYQWLKNIRSLEDCMPKPDKEGYTEYQLWEFANIFGEHLYNGAEQIIKDNEIIFVERLSKKVEFIKNARCDIEWVEEYIIGVGETHKQVYVDALERVDKMLEKLEKVADVLEN